MPDATLTSKGQTTIPKDIRRLMGLKAGDRLSFTLLQDGTLVVRAKTRRLAQLGGLLARKGRKTLPVHRLSR